ncbi:MAG: PAS domain S-box protein [Dehalococcoidia bacterium]
MVKKSTASHNTPKTNAELRQVEGWYRLVAESTSDLVVVTTVHGIIVYASPSFARLGYEPKELAGKLGFDLVHPDDIPSLAPLAEKYTAKNLPRLLARKRTVSEFIRYRLRDASGQWRDMETTMNWVKGVHGDEFNVVAVSRDVTERKQAEEELISQREWFQSLIDNSLDAVVVLNGDGTPRYISSSAQRVLGYEPGDLGGRNLVDDVHPDDLQNAMEAFAELLEGSGRTLHNEIRSRHKDGSWRTLEVVGRNLVNDPKVNGIVCNYRDITERKQAEEALRQSEQEHSLLVGNLADAVFRYKDGAITWANDRIKEMLGYTNEELIGADVNVFLPDEASFSEMYIAANAGLKQQSHFHGTTRARKKDGSIADIEFTASLVPGKVPFEIVGIARDITERKRMQEALLIKDNAIEKSITAMAISDVQGTITYVNEACLRLWRMASREDVLGQSFWALLQLDDEAVGNEVASSMIEKGSWQGELSCSKRDGEQIDVQVLTAMICDEQGKPIQTITSFIDITERKRAEEALRIKENAIENSVDAIVMTDMEGRLTYINQAGLKIWGSSRKEDLLGEPYSSLLKSEELAAEIAAAMSENLVWQGELAATRKDGKDVHVEVSASLVIDNQGNPIQTISSARDVTEAKRAEAEKRTMEQQLLLTGRLAAVGELAAGVAHELNNPIAAVQAYAQFLSSREDLDESTRSDVETIYKEAKRASKITANLLSFARKHEPEKTFICINKVVEESLELNVYRMKVNNIEISTELAPNLPNTMADFHQLQQVFVNLVTNAEQAMTEAHGKGRLTVTTQRAGDTIRITFTDNGPGIDEENLKRLFDPFYTTKAVGKGTGLGLSICYGIVQEHGGQLYARSKPGDGATFVVELPIIA